MDNTVIVKPEYKDTSLVKWEVNSTFYQIDSKTTYQEALIIIDRKQVIVFFDKSNINAQYVAKVFNFNGDLLLDIPFPKLDTQYGNVEISYMWSVEIEHGVKIIFGSNSVSFGDAWCDYDFEIAEYTAMGTSH